ncbi:c-type cytochrome, partial [uncultured Campylobacter sp.]|uniref:c-type cytochrome n=1 Tax=uncultured Campylobacter sp. TaxID=218934 RepID=UPI00263A28F1
MKKLIVVSGAAALLAGSLFAADGATLYKKCAACHGEKADVKYANKVPALTSISKEDRIKALQSYKDGSNNNFGMGKV